jgi:hypothetical protein
MAAVDFTVVRLQQLVVAFHNFAPTLQHLCRAPPVGSWPPLRRVRHRPPTSPLARSSVVQSDPPIPRLPLRGLWRRGIDSAPRARGGTEASGPTLLSQNSAGPRPDQPGDFSLELALVPNAAALFLLLGSGRGTSKGTCAAQKAMPVESQTPVMHERYLASARNSAGPDMTWTGCHLCRH